MFGYRAWVPVVFIKFQMKYPRLLHASLLLQVVQKIRAVEHRTRLLVVDRETDEYLRLHGLTCTEDRAIEMGSLSPRTSVASSPRTSAASSPRASASPSPCASFTAPSLTESLLKAKRAVSPLLIDESAAVHNGLKVGDVTRSAIDRLPE